MKFILILLFLFKDSFKCFISKKKYVLKYSASNIWNETKINVFHGSHKTSD